MQLTYTKRTRIHIDAEIEADCVDESATQPLSVEAGQLAVSGRVTDERTGNALAGARIFALETGQPHATPLGTATSDAHGKFSIELVETVNTREHLLALQNQLDAEVTLRVETIDGLVLFTSPPIQLNQPHLNVGLAVPIPTEAIPRSRWAALGTDLKQARIARLNGVVQLLSNDAPSGTHHGNKPIPLFVRQAMLDQLEQAFLDPTGILRKTVGDVPSLQEMHDPDLEQAYELRIQAHQRNPALASAFEELKGKAASFVSLAEVDWAIDPSLFEQGNVGGAVNKFSGEYLATNQDRPTLHLETNLTLYRDYLLAIWTTGAIANSPGTNLTADQARVQLETRFHQSFTTFDEKQKIAHQVLIPILIAIVTAPTGFGFGHPASSLAPPGTLTPRAYLDLLISLTSLSAVELGLRFRLDLTRSDTELSSPVQENIAALQGFFRDSFQCDPDPGLVTLSIIPDAWQGNAPFFLYFDEWLRQQAPFYPENYLDMRRILPIDVGARGRTVLAELIAGKGVDPKTNVPVWKFCQHVLAVWDKLQTGHAYFYEGEYALASIDYQSAHDLAFTAMRDGILQSLPMSAIYNLRKKLPLNTVKDVPDFSDSESNRVTDGAFDYGSTSDDARDALALRLAYYALFTIPICQGDADYASGNYDAAIFHYGQATRFKVGIAHETDPAGSSLYSFGDKPFTVLLFGPDALDNAPYPTEVVRRFDTPPDLIDDYAVRFSRRIAHLAEVRLFHLRQANVMLEFADALYRENDPTSKARARELYKGVLFLHGLVPPICPTWPVQFFGGTGTGVALHPGAPPMFLHQSDNPAWVSQTNRALRGVFQIDHGLNYYGENDNIVPVLRYRPLKTAADRTAAMARGAQQDFLQYTDRVEQGITTQLQLANLLRKSTLQSSIADEQRAIAEHDVVVAQDQVAAVEAAIKAKQDEIAQHDSIFGQIGDAVKTVKSLYDGIPDDTKSAVGAPVKAATTGKEMAGEGMLGLGAAGSLMTGFGIFAVVGYVTLTGLRDAADQRSADLAALGKALTAAQAAVVARQHGVTISTYQRMIAQADVDLAQTLIAFEENRVLNKNFWLQLAQLSRRLLRRYLELGARIAWLAERALAYEQDRTLQIVRLDYFPPTLQGVSGADLLQADLAELDATRIEGLKRTVPVRRTVSLARTFPLQFGLLKTTGRCAFRTEEAFFRSAYPGTSAYRVRDVSVAILQTDLSQPLRGSLINRGISISKPQRPGEHVLVRPSESLPLSEFRLDRDMAVYGLPDERLLTFEGSSIETFWEVGLPKAANPAGLDGVLDVMLTFDLFCEFEPERYETDLASLPTSERKWILISGKQFDPAAVADLAGPAGTADVVFNLPDLRLLPRQEKSRIIKNLAAFVVTPNEIDFTAKLSAAKPATSASAKFTKGLALSTLHPDPSVPPLPASPLDAFAGVDPNQAFTLSIAKSANPGVDFRGVTDVILALEYEASFV